MFILGLLIDPLSQSFCKLIQQIFQPESCRFGTIISIVFCLKSELSDFVPVLLYFEKMAINGIVIPNHRIKSFSYLPFMRLLSVCLP